MRKPRLREVTQLPQGLTAPVGTHSGLVTHTYTRGMALKETCHVKKRAAVGNTDGRHGPGS